jgi:hypothetical protein
MLKGVGDIFWFQQTRIFNSELHEGDLNNQKLRTVRLLELALPIHKHANH